MVSERLFLRLRLEVPENKEAGESGGEEYKNQSKRTHFSISESQSERERERDFDWEMWVK